MPWARLGLETWSSSSACSSIHQDPAPQGFTVALMVTGSCTPGSCFWCLAEWGEMHGMLPVPSVVTQAAGARLVGLGLPTPGSIFRKPEVGAADTARSFWCNLWFHSFAEAQHQQFRGWVLSMAQHSKAGITTQTWHGNHVPLWGSSSSVGSLGLVSLPFLALQPL